jgi:hypothetical protein
MFSDILKNKDINEYDIAKKEIEKLRLRKIEIKKLSEIIFDNFSRINNEMVL